MTVEAFHEAIRLVAKSVVQVAHSLLVLNGEAEEILATLEVLGDFCQGFYLFSLKKNNVNRCNFQDSDRWINALDAHQVLCNLLPFHGHYSDLSLFFTRTPHPLAALAHKQERDREPAQPWTL